MGQHSLPSATNQANKPSMSFVKFAAYCALFAALSACAHAQVDCSDKPDGVYGWGCRAYTICQGGNGTSVECTFPDVFNPEIERCDDPGNVGPPCGLFRDCTDKEDGRYADLFVNCTAYYTCDAGMYLGHNPCPPGLVFDEIDEVCDWPYDVLPPCGTKEEDY